MATKNGINYIKSITANSIIEAGEAGGKLKCLVDSVTLAAAEGAALDEINVCSKLPKGAIVHDAVISCSSLGFTGIVSLGFAATLDSAGGVLAKDNNAFVDAADASGQAVTKSGTDSANLAGILVKFGQETQPILTFDEFATTPLGAKIKVAIYYTLD